MTTLKNSNYNKTKFQNFSNLKTKIMTGLKNYNCDKKKKIKLLQNLKAPVWTKLKNSNSDQTQKLTI